MAQQKFASYRRRWLSLPVRIAVGLVLAAVIPLGIMLLYISLQTSPALIEQANKAMANDASTRVQLINTYFNERILDVETLAQVTSVQTFLVSRNPVGSAAYRDEAVHASYSLVAGQFRDHNYTAWSLFSPNGQLLLTYPQNALPQPHGQSLVPPTELQMVNAGKVFISPVYYSSTNQKASVELYAPIAAPMPIPSTTVQPGKVTGFIRATLTLDYIWNDVVQRDLGNNGTGSYAFLVDENGVRIAATDPQQRFSSIAPLNPDMKQLIAQEARYGTVPVPLLRDDAIAESLQSPDASATFQATPYGKQEQFQIVRQATLKTLVPWNYFVLSPESTETAVANQQLISTALIAAIASLCVAIIGLLVGHGISRPIMSSVDYLRGNSTALSTLATSQQEAAAEQMWVVDSSQIGLQSVQYYTDATSVAARQLQEMTTRLARNWQHAEMNQINQTLESILKAARYLEEASEYQNVSNQKLATALRVATQVTEQFHLGATSATEAATQLEKVVQDLRNVIKR